DILPTTSERCDSTELMLAQSAEGEDSSSFFKLDTNSWSSVSLVAEDRNSSSATSHALAMSALPSKKLETCWTRNRWFLGIFSMNALNSRTGSMPGSDDISAWKTALNRG